jgi:S1-C subfamily serine protease
MKYLTLLLGIWFSAPAFAETEYKPSLPVTTVESMSRVEKKVRDAALKVTVPFSGGHGTGSYIQYKDLHLVVTAQHVAHGRLGTNYLLTHKNESHLGVLIYADEDNDIAILYVGNHFKFIKPMKYNPREDVAPPGTEIIYSGFPSDHKLMSFTGRVAGHEDAPGIGQHLVLQTYGWFGCSGSAIYDLGGRLVGILYGIDVEYYPNIRVQENMIWVVPINKINIQKAIKPFCNGYQGKEPKACK